MTDKERFQHAKLLFTEVVDLPPAERAAALTARCGDDAQMRAEVETLIAGSELEDRLPRVPAVLSVVASRAPGGDLRSVGALMIGRRLGGYELLDVIAEGGMGVVYRARQLNPQRTVALKVIRPGLASRSALRRFEDESRLLARLNHPGIARVFEAGTSEDGLPYFAMELVEGARPITTFAHECALSTAERLAMLAQVCDAAHHAHQKGVIHRDLKPSNILVGRAEDSEGGPRDAATAGAPLTRALASPRIIDFGVARVTDSAARAATLETSAGVLVGTLAYMSPEQCEGDPHKVDVRSDVYALGVIAYELLTGAMPYDVTGTSLAAAPRLIRESSPRRPALLRPELKGDIEQVVLKALEKEPERRYQSAADFGADLRRILAHEPVVARPPTAVYLARKFVRRHPAGVGAAALVFVTLVIASVVSTWQYLKARTAQEAEATERARADARSEELSRRGYAQQLGLAQASTASGDAARALALLERADPAHRGFEWRHLRHLADRSSASVQAHPGGVAAVVCTTQGDVPIVFSLGSSGHLLGCNAQTLRPTHAGRAVSHPRDQGESLALAVNPAGTMLATGNVDGLIRFYDALTLDPITLTNPPARVSTAVWSLAFNRAGTRLAAGDSERNVRVFDAATGALQRTFGVHTTALLGVAFANDDRDVWSCGLDGLVRAWDVESGTLVASFRSHSARATSLAVSRDSRTIACSGEDGSIQLIDARTRTPGLLLRASPDGVRSVAFSPDGQTLASAGRDGSIRIWRVSDAKPLWMLCAHGGATAVTFSSDGSSIISGGAEGTLKTWNAHLGPAVPIVNGAADSAAALRFSPSGKHLVTPAGLGGGAALALRDAATGEPLALLRGDGRYQVCAAWDEAGQNVAHGSLDGGVSLFDTTALSPRATVKVFSTPLTDLAFTAQGLLASSEVEIILLDRATLGVLQRVPKPTRGPAQFTLAPDTDGPGPTKVLVADGALSRLNQGVLTPVLALGARVPASQVAATATLVATSEGERIVLRSAGSLAPVRILTGHRAAVLSLAFTPDGTRLASGSEDRTVRLWDTATGEELLVLSGRDRAGALQFSPDGRCLAVTRGDGLVELLETGPPDCPPAQRAAVTAATDLLNALYDRLGVTDDVLAALESDTVLQPVERATALRMAKVRGDDATDLNTAAWGVVSRPGASPTELSLAARKAGVAASLRPQDGFILNTLGVALFRQGLFEDAITTLTRSRAMNEQRSGRLLPADLAFIAMSLERLERHDESYRAFDELQACMKHPVNAADLESQAFYAEATAAFAPMRRP